MNHNDGNVGRAKGEEQDRCLCWGLELLRSSCGESTGAWEDAHGKMSVAGCLTATGSLLKICLNLSEYSSPRRE
ncbi:hypothetical protein AV530_018552 [Patagioenas fasciata monilis]|uniref:Uncharacterized protein n=1 Tax=Patagioenas fasciata monilis TaxID=372326 RepID=A0A1V4JSL7_PATFA|nr:hypothetical protein AV530_018552 [Patagioenas fasciata monilis]